MVSVNILAQWYKRFYFECLALVNYVTTESAIWRKKRSLQPFLTVQLAGNVNVLLYDDVVFKKNNDNKSKGHLHFSVFSLLCDFYRKQEDNDKKKGYELYSYGLITKHTFFLIKQYHLKDSTPNLSPNVKNPGKLSFK